MRIFGLAVAALLVSAPALAQSPAFDPRTWKGDHTASPTRVMTLGSAHLNQMEKPVTPEMLAPLLDKLAAFHPDIITHEGLSGEQCDQMQRYAAKYPGMFETYCWPADDAQKATGLTVASALAEIDTMLAAWPANPAPVQRRHLAALFLAAGDRPSARVQWAQLPAGERKLGDGIDDTLLKMLSATSKGTNETMAVAVALAVRLGHQRVYAVDDHTADSVQALAGEGFGPFMQAFWSRVKSPLADENRRRAANLPDGAAMLDYYRFLNQPATPRPFISIDQGDAARTPSPQGYGRQYLAWWEVRNLRMVANIRAAFANDPGARVLNVVGASHKPYYDAYLDMMSDVQVVDTEGVLK